MAKRKAAKAKPTTTKANVGQVEPVVVKLAARLGSILGRGAGRLSKLVPVKKTSAKKAKKSAARRHRKAASSELFDPRLGKPMGNQVRQKNRRRGPRGAA